MKNIFILIFFALVNCQSHKENHSSNKENNYIFFLHNKFLEENPDGTFVKKYGVKIEYSAILNHSGKTALWSSAVKGNQKQMW